MTNGEVIRSRRPSLLVKVSSFRFVYINLRKVPVCPLQYAERSCNGPDILIKRVGRIYEAI